MDWFCEPGHARELGEPEIDLPGSIVDSAERGAEHPDIVRVDVQGAAFVAENAVLAAICERGRKHRTFAQRVCEFDLIRFLARPRSR